MPNSEQTSVDTSTPPYATIQSGYPVGTDYNPNGGDLTPQEAANRIQALYRKAQKSCYLPEDPDANNINAGRVRALAQAIELLRRAGIYPDDGAAWLTDEEEMETYD